MIVLEKEFKTNSFEGKTKDLVLDYLSVTNVDDITRIVIKSKDKDYKKWKVILWNNEGKKCVIKFRYSEGMKTLVPYFPKYSEFKIGFGFSSINFTFKIRAMGLNSIYHEIKDYVIKWGEIDKEDKKLIEDKINERYDGDVYISADENKLTSTKNCRAVDVEASGRIVDKIPIKIRYKDVIIKTEYPIHEKYS